MDKQRLYDILAETTIQLRKGAEVEHRERGNLKVTEVYAMPHESDAPDGVEKVDCEFITIGVRTKEAAARKAELITILNDYPEPKRLAGGPSYIEVGAELGDQGLAFNLFALGQVLGLWKLITPRTLGFTDDAEVRYMAGQGLIMITGYKNAA